MGRSGAVHATMLNKLNVVFMEHWLVLFAVLAAAILVWLVYSITMENRAIRNLEAMHREAMAHADPEEGGSAPAAGGEA